MGVGRGEQGPLDFHHGNFSADALEDGTRYQPLIRENAFSY